MPEDGTRTVRELWESRARAATSLLALPEARAALAAAARGGRLTQAAHEQAVENLGGLLDQTNVLGIDGELAAQAADLAEAEALRGYDAVHLATALSLARPTMVTWDRELARAASRRGCAVAPPG